MDWKFAGAAYTKHFLTAAFVSLLFTGCFVSGRGASNAETGKNQTAAQAAPELAQAAKNNDVQTDSGSQKKVILWDFRNHEDKLQTFSKAETEAVLKYLLGDARDKDLGITSRISGSFTKPNAKETLYYVGGCKEGEEFTSTMNCGHVSWWNAGWIAIYDGTTPIVKIEAALGYEIVKTTDVNGDGINEIFSLTGFSNMGETVTSGKLGQIAGGEYKEIETFNGYADNCGAVHPQFSKAAVVSYISSTGDTIPAFSQDYFRGDCKNTEWKRISRKEFDSN